jgi:hypothetical protein
VALKQDQGFDDALLSTHFLSTKLSTAKELKKNGPICSRDCFQSIHGFFPFLLFPEYTEPIITNRNQSQR